MVVNKHLIAMILPPIPAMLADTMKFFAGRVDVFRPSIGTYMPITFIVPAVP